LASGEISLDEADKVLKDIEAKAKKKFLPIVGPHRGQILVKAIRETSPKRVLEVGTFIGYSAILMARELESGAQVITIEIDADEAELARENIRKAKVRPSVEVITDDATEVIPRLSGEFDMVFMDAKKPRTCGTFTSSNLNSIKEA
jgi:predicted O-methyltransferase YrrM